MRAKTTLTIRRDDHLDDSLAAVFFDPAPVNEAEVIRRLRAYLGPRVHLVRAEVGAREITVGAEAASFPEESARLADEAALLRASGGRRSAATMLGEAIELDPFNVGALMQLGRLLIELKRPEPALQAFIRAREIGGDTAAVMRGMAEASLALERKASAIVYLKQALELEPKNFWVLRTLSKLGYQTPGRPRRAGTSGGGTTGNKRPSGAS